MKTTHRGNAGLTARRLVIAACCAAMIGCQTFTPLGSAGADLQQEIRSGMLVKPGEQVRITTIDGKSYEFVVRTVDDTMISGRQYQVDIDDIQHIERGKTSAGKTALVVGGIAALMIGAILSTADMGPN